MEEGMNSNMEEEDMDSDTEEEDMDSDMEEEMEFDLWGGDCGWFQRNSYTMYVHKCTIDMFQISNWFALVYLFFFLSPFHLRTS